MTKGSCLCGTVKFEVKGDMRPIIACHCTQCRKQTGNYYTTTSALDADLTITGADSITWYRASESAARGFCKTCGSALFWRADGRNETSILAGSIDGPTGLAVEGHIYCAFKGDYYDIPPGGYHKDEWS